MVPTGYWVNFNNNAFYDNTHLSGAMFGNENLIKTGPDAYVGWPISALRSEEAWEEILANAYNNQDKKGWLLWPFGSGAPWNITAQAVRGYDANAIFINIPKLAQSIFALRTGT